MTIQLTEITADYTTTPQINADDVADLTQMGFKTIINCRPDDEGGDTQPTSAQIQAAAEAYGIAYFHIPVVPKHILPAQIEALAAAYAATPKPIIAFCRTGNRAAQLFKLAQEQQSKTSLTQSKSCCFVSRFWAWYKPKCLFLALCRKCCKHCAFCKK